MKQVILMADIIGSSNQPPKDLMRAFKTLVAGANKRFGAALKSPLTITLGDEFQGVVADINTGVAIMLFMEEELIRKQADFKLRFVLLEGQIDTALNRKIAYAMLGPGLTEARKKLTELKESHHRFYIALIDAPTTVLLNNAFLLLQLLVGQWKPEKDYELAYHFIRYGDYKKVAALLNKNRSLMWKRERTLNIESYGAIKNIILTAAKHSLP